MTRAAMNTGILLAIAAGSAIGGVCRYMLTVAVNRDTIPFPIGTLAVNIIGCFAIAVFVQYSVATGRMSDTTRFFLTTGFCGGFTTFSTFTYETVLLLTQGAWLRAAAYIAASVFGGLAAFALGMKLVMVTR